MREIFTSIRRTPYQSLAGFLVLFFTLLLSTVLFISLNFLFGLLGYIETRPQVVVYFQTQTSEDQIFKLRDQLLETGKIGSIDYVSKKEAFEILKESEKDSVLISEMTPVDVLPASLEMNAKLPQYLPEIAKFLEKQAGVDTVQFNKDILDKLLALTNTIRQISFILFSYLIFMAVVVLITITLFKIALKKDEIELQRLLGASNFFIRKPFIKESVFMGLFASIISFLVAVGILFGLQPFLSSYLRDITKLTSTFYTFNFTIWPIGPEFLAFTFGLVALFGMIIAFLASYFATAKYLK